MRGKWVLENLLGMPPPPPPANVPPLKENKPDGGKPLSVRERMVEHRANPRVRILPFGDGSDRSVG